MMSLWDALRMNMMISYQELVRTFPSYRRKTADAGDALCLRCITVLEPLRCRELPLSENLLTTATSGRPDRPVRDVFSGTAVAHRQYIFRFSAVDFVVTGTHSNALWITNADVSRGLLMAGISGGNPRSRRLPVSLTGQMVVLKPFRAAIWFYLFTAHSGSAGNRRHFALLLGGFCHGTLPSAQPSRLRR